MKRSCAFFSVRALALTLMPFSLALSLASAARAACPSGTPEPGCVRFNMLAYTSFDGYTNHPTVSQQQWFQQHFWGIRTATPYWNPNLPWFPSANIYVDSYGVLNTSSLVQTNPNWLMHDIHGNLLFIPYACANGKCSQYAGDFSNPSFRNWWISQRQAQLANGYESLWIDDVNLNMTVSNGYGTATPPVDAATGAPMTQAAWETYFTEFLQQIRSAFPNATLFHNSIWFAGSTPAGSDPNVQKQIQAANIINVERGFSDSGLTGGSGQWSVSALMSFMDLVHSLGRTLEIEPTGFNGEYDLAGYFLVWASGDLFSNVAITPNNWPALYDVQLGSPQGPRYNWQGLVRRDYSNGVVLMNYPSSPTVTVAPAGTFTDAASGKSVSSVTLAAAQGSVLVGVPYFPQPAISVNVGGGSVQSFESDQYFTGGSTDSTTHTINMAGVPNTAPMAVYQDRRFGVQNGTGFTYTIPNLVAGHSYQVQLLFSDPYATGAGQRLFNVVCNGQTELTNFDIYALTGAMFTAYNVTFSATPNSGNQIVLQFQQGKTSLPPMVNGITVTP